MIWFIFQDIDECMEQPEVCQSYQTCENSYGSYRCIDPIDCRPGYEVDPNGQMCVGELKYYDFLFGYYHLR